jgi:hypothetical protein
MVERKILKQFWRLAALFYFLTVLFLPASTIASDQENFPWILFTVPRSQSSPDDTTPDDTTSKYIGTLKLHLVSNLMPQFDESATSNIKVIMDTGKEKLTGTTATLYYDSDENNGDGRIRRNGYIDFTPTGTCNDDVCIVNPMPLGVETITYWAWDDDTHTWIEFLHESIPIDWTDSEYTFDKPEALATDGAIIGFNAVAGLTNAGGGSWTLHLTPNQD